VTQDYQPFKLLEHAGWSESGVSQTYETWFTSLTSQSIEPLLDAVGFEIGSPAVRHRFGTHGMSRVRFQFRGVPIVCNDGAYAS
jgi:hypothetical protein